LNSPSFSFSLRAHERSDKRGSAVPARFLSPLSSFLQQYVKKDRNPIAATPSEKEKLLFLFFSPLPSSFVYKQMTLKDVSRGGREHFCKVKFFLFFPLSFSFSS